MGKLKSNSDIRENVEKFRAKGPGKTQILGLAGALFLLAACATDGANSGYGNTAGIGYGNGSGVGYGAQQQGRGTGAVLGTLGGAAAGGFAGSQFGKGKGKLAGTAGGTLLGALLGGALGSAVDAQGNAPANSDGLGSGGLITFYQMGRIEQLLDYQDQAGVQQVRDLVLSHPNIGQEVFWNNPGTGVRISGMATGQGLNPAGLLCRDYTQVLVVRDRQVHAEGTVCQMPDGGWQLSAVKDSVGPVNTIDLAGLSLNPPHQWTPSQSRRPDGR